jgi:hypothetical protein
MDNPLHICGHSCEAALEVLDSEGQSFLGLTCEHRLVHLDVAASGRGQRSDLNIEGVAQGAIELSRVVVVVVSHRVGDSHRPGEGDLDRPRRVRLRDLAVVGKESIFGADTIGDSWHFTFSRSGADLA